MSRLIKTSNKMELSDIQRSAGSGGKFIFTDYRGQHAALLIQDNRLTAARFFDKDYSKIGAIYICKVKNSIPNLGAYFVEINGHEICFLSKKDAAYPFLLNRIYNGRILEGDEFPVQVIKDAQKTKQASVTTLISFSNECFALSVGNTRTGYSNKFSEADKKRMQELIEREDFSIPDIPLPHSSAECKTLLPAGFVVRTQAAGQEHSYLINAFAQLTEKYIALFQTAMHRTCFSCLMEPPAPWQAALEQLAYPYEYDEIITDNVETYKQISESHVCPDDKNLRLYEDRQFSLTKLYGLDSKLCTATERRIWLKSGGYLIIDKTEALTVIDVNSGKYEAKRDSEETFYFINREAAAEIALQLRLRNLNGIIIVDFINMRDKSHQNHLLEYLKELVLYDRTKTVVVDMTPLGLVEITRQKNYKSLAEQIQWN